MFHVSSFKSFERPFLRAGQAVKSVRPESKFLVPCEHSLTLSLTMQRILLKDLSFSEKYLENLNIITIFAAKKKIIRCGLYQKVHS